MEKIIYLKLDDIKPYENNPRNNDEAVDKVAKSIKDFGFRSPIIVDKNNVVICGHTRLRASYQLGLKEAPVIVADDLSQEQVNALRLVDNKTNEFAKWDFDRLEEELLNIDFDLTDFGFDLADFEEKEETPKEREDLSDKAGSMFQVIIDCENEEEQEALYNRFMEEGLLCRVLTL